MFNLPTQDAYLEYLNININQRQFLGLLKCLNTKTALLSYEPFLYP